MSKYRERLQGEVIPQDWLDALQEFISTLASNFVLEKATSTSVRVVAGTDNDQVALGINGKWRWISSTVTAAVPGTPAAGTYSVYALSSDNSFTSNDSPPPNELDETDYSFTLEIRTSGTPSSDLWRKVGEVVWNGTAITDVIQTVGGSSGVTLHATTHEPGGSDAISWPLIARTMLLSGTLGSRPTAGTANNGYYYRATDVNGGTVYQSNGSSWTAIAAGVTEWTSAVIAKVTAVSSLTTAQRTSPGIAWIRAGTSRKIVVWDSVLSKWVSEDELLVTRSYYELLVNSSYPYPTQADQDSGVYGATPWKVYDTAGLTPQFRLTTNSETSVGVTGYIRCAYVGVDDGGNLEATTQHQITEITMTGDVDIQKDSGWVDIPGGYSVKDYLLCRIDFKVSASSGMDVQLAQVRLRWVG